MVIMLAFYSIMSRLYFITLHNKVFNTRVKSRTCLIGITEKPAAERVGKVLKRSHGIHNIEISEIDYLRQDFYNMLKLNQFTLLVANDIKFLDNGFEFNGDIIDSPHVTRIELENHLEKLYVQDDP